MEIRLLERDEIDAPRWNGCVHYAPNSLIYGYTWYLDNVCKNWVGLVEGNYESVFPLVFNEKMFGIKRMYQPYLCQQLGLFTVNGFSRKRIQAFIDAIPKEFKHIDINLNESTVVKELQGFEIQEKANYLLPLNLPYEKLQEQYSKNHKRNIKKGEKAQLFGTTSIKPEDFVEQVKISQAAKGNKHPEKLYHTAHRIIYNCLHRGQGFIMGCLNQDKELCAAVFWMVNGARYINLLNVTTEAGREIGAMHFLVDQFIQSNANRPVFIDFEGSNIDSIARFYEGFGAENMPYYNIKQNRLPWWIKWRG